VAYFKFSAERVEKIISVRKGFAVVNAFLVIAAISILFSGPDPHQHAYLLFPASSVIIAYYFIEMKKMIWPEILFLLLLASIVVVKFI
jgi:4-hydroxybenzoate polyprenyltransferase